MIGDRPPHSAADVLARPELIAVFAAVQGSFAWTRGALASAGWLGWLAELPLEVRTVLPDGTRVLGVHGTPGRDDGDGISPHRPEEELRAELAGAEADIVIAGHTHRPTDRWIGAVRALNGGSVSNPITDERRATYVVVHAGEDGHRVEHRRVEYDHDTFLERVRRVRPPRARVHRLVPAGRAVPLPVAVTGGARVGRLILWDIDGTLIRSGGVGRRVVEEAAVLVEASPRCPASR